MIILHSIIFYYISIFVHTNESLKESIFDEMSDLQDLCPYSSFCGHNASSEFKYSLTYFPCCHSCSCSSECGLQDNCCFSKLDGNTILDDVICRHSFSLLPFKYRDIAQRATYYKMVDKCYCSNEIRNRSGNSCGQSFQNMVFSPVYSHSTGRIYSNIHYAACNNDHDTTPWQKSIVCPPDVEPSMPEIMNLLDDEKNMSSDEYGCLLYYLPPKELNSDDAICFPNIIRKCNTTRRMKTRQPFWDFCEKFNATYTIQTLDNLKAYANVYCFMCNTFAVTDNIKEMQCAKQGSGREKIFQFASLTIILNNNVIQEFPYSKREHQKSQICLNGTLLIASFKTECRQLQCKKGQLLINNRCGYFSRQWIGGPFIAMLRLTPVYKDVFFPTSFFTEMPARKRNDRHARWLMRRKLESWTFHVFYHPSRHQTYIEYFVVKAMYPSTYVNPHVLNESVKEALGSVWYIDAENLTVRFNVGFNDYVSYDLISRDTMLHIGINTSNEFGYVPKFVRCKLGSSIVDALEEILFPVVLRFDDYELNKGFFITELFFCDQVDLLPEEFYFLPECLNMIFFKLKNTTLHKFSLVRRDVVRLVNVGDEIKSTTLDKQTVRICANEFGQKLSMASVITVYFSGIFMAWLVAMYFAYII